MDRRPSWRSDRQPGLAALWALLPTLLGIGVTLWVLMGVREQQSRTDRLRLERHSQRIARILESRMTGYEDLLRGVHAFCRQGGEPTPAAWKAYSNDLDFLHRHPGLKTLVKVERVQKGDLERFLAQNQGNGLPPRLCEVKSLDPSDTSLPLDASEHLVITRAEPSETASRALGMDVGTSFHQRRAAERATATGKPALTGPLQFRAGGVAQTSVAIFYPIYRGQGSLATAEERRQEVASWVSLGIYLDAFLEAVKEGSDDAVSTEIFDLSDGAAIRLHPKAGSPFDESKVDQVVRRLDVFGRTWGLVSKPLPAFYAGPQRNREPQILVTGLVASLSLGAVLWSLASTRDRAHRLAEQQTRSMREALRRLDMLIESTPVGVVEWDSKLRVRRWNPAAEAIFGFEAQEVLEHSGSTFRVPELAGVMARESLEEVIREARSVSQSQEGVCKNGQRIVCEWTSSPIYDAEGRVEGVLSLVMDVTVRRLTEERAWLHQKLESLGVMAGGIAHDFNNLLWAISGNAELARDRIPQDNPVQENLARIESAAFRAADLARQMLAFAGRAPFVLRPLDLGAIIRGVEEIIRAAIPRTTRLDFVVQGGIPEVKGDEGHIQQALSNLLTNAAEAMGDAGGCARVKVYQVTVDEVALGTLVPGSAISEGPSVCVEVQDEGPGMDPETLAKVFDPFFTTKSTGRGLGLSATLGIMKAHGGGIAVESNPGHGTMVRLYFPTLSETPMDQQKEPFESRVARGGTILLAEDEEILRELTVEALEPAGFRVITADDGLRALELFEALATEISIVVLDLNMPRMGGLEAFRRIRALDPAVKVILCSGFAEEEIGEWGDNLRPDGFLHKPYRLRELIRMVGSLV